MSEKGNQVIRNISQKTMADFVESKVQVQDEIILEVNELPLSFKRGTIFTFGEIESTDLTHSLHAYPAKFVPQIPHWAISYAKLVSPDEILDPFCGCGTTLVEACRKGLNSYGIDIDPLARFLSAVKCRPLYRDQPKLIFDAFSELSKRIREDGSRINLEDQSDVALHYNWRYWFNEETMKLLIKLKRCIRSFDPPLAEGQDEKQAIRDFFTICLSSTIKKVSFLDEEQIKVKRSEKKYSHGVRNAVTVFEEICRKNMPGIMSFTKRTREYPKTIAKIIGTDARSIPLANGSIKLIATSPPYINAIDYPFSHKHELFILDMLKPENYRPHSREYIGVSERVLLKSMYEDIHLCGYEPVDWYIRRIYAGGQDVDRNRAYVVYQYFTGMEKFLNEASRVLSDDGLLVVFVGDNHIRKIYVPTHGLLMGIAEDRCGFRTETFFYHQLKRKKFGLPRHITGNQIGREMAMVLRKS